MSYKKLKKYTFINLINVNEYNNTIITQQFNMNTEIFNKSIEKYIVELNKEIKSKTKHMLNPNYDIFEFEAYRYDRDSWHMAIILVKTLKQIMSGLDPEDYNSLIKGECTYDEIIENIQITDGLERSEVINDVNNVNSKLCALENTLTYVKNTCEYFKIPDYVYALFETDGKRKESFSYAAAEEQYYGVEKYGDKYY